MNPNITYRKHNGLSLIELMVALAVSATMLTGVATIYSASKRGFEINHEMAGIQENARFALHTLTSAIRMAGFTGCKSSQKLKLLVATNFPPAPLGVDLNKPIETDGLPYSVFDLNTFLTGHTNNNGNWTPSMEAGTLPGNTVAGSDALTIKNSSTCSAFLNQNNGNAATPNLVVQGNCNFKQDDSVIVTDCSKSVLYTITNNPQGNNPVLEFASGTNNHSTGILGNFKRGDTRVHKADVVVYYVGIDGNNNPGLYENRLVGAQMVETLLVPNVESMAMTYGLDLDGDPLSTIDREEPAVIVNALPQTSYQSAINTQALLEIDPIISPWSRVFRVNLQLLLVSEPFGTKEREFDFNGQTFISNQSRRAFNTAINIRNRTF